MTLVLDGELLHADNRGVLRTNDVQWMTAGGGIIHAELPHEESLVHSLQLGVSMPSGQKMVPSTYQDLHAADSPVAEDESGSIRVISGEMEGTSAPVHNAVPVLYLDTTVEAGVACCSPCPPALTVSSTSSMAQPNSGLTRWRATLGRCSGSTTRRALDPEVAVALAAYAAEIEALRSFVQLRSVDMPPAGQLSDEEVRRIRDAALRIITKCRERIRNIAEPVLQLTGWPDSLLPSDDALEAQLEAMDEKDS